MQYTHILQVLPSPPPPHTHTHLHLSTSVTHTHTHTHLHLSTSVTHTHTHTHTHVPITLFEFGVLHNSLHYNPAMNHISLLLHKAVPPGRREASRHNQGQGRVGVHGGEILLDPGPNVGGHVPLVGLRKSTHHQPIQETWTGRQSTHVILCTAMAV